MSARRLGFGTVIIVMWSLSSAAGAQTPSSPAVVVPQCASGMVLIPASLANPGTAASPVASAASVVSGIPSPSGLVAGALKNKLLKKGDSTPPRASASAPSAGSASPFVCVTPAQAQAYLQSAQSAAASMQSPEQAAAAQKDAMKSAVVGALAATPQGMLASGAIAAAPTASKAVKSLAGRFGRGGESRESMVHGLQQGRLELKGIRFVVGSDEMADGFEQTIAQLADALQSVDGQFAVIVVPESDGKSPPDTAMASRRMARLAAHLQLAGIGADRVIVAEDAIGTRTPGGRTLGAHMSASKMPKIGEARVELVRVATRP